MILELSIVPEHSTSILGLSTDMKWIRFRSLRPQNRTSRRNLDKFGRTSRGTGSIEHLEGGGRERSEKQQLVFTLSQYNQKVSPDQFLTQRV